MLYNIFNVFLIVGVTVTNTSAYGPRPHRAVRYSNVYCRGHEDMLEDCIHHTIELYAGRNYRGEVAAVDCKGMCLFCNSTTYYR